MPSARRNRAKFGFLIKIVIAAALVIIADLLFFDHPWGWTIGLFALLWAATLPVTAPAVRRNGQARVALAAACVFALILVDDPSLLGWSLFWIALALAALLPRRRFDDAWRWTLRLIMHAFASVIGPINDLSRLSRVRRAAAHFELRSVSAMLALPLLGGGVFIALFASANPLIGNALSAIRLPSLGEYPLLRILFWIFALISVWAVLRPRRFATRIKGGRIDPDMLLPTVPVASITLSLIVFNLIFAVQNGLDLLFLWSGAPLPEGVTLADYAHRGAYSLIATALLAGLFVLVTLRPGSETAQLPLLRRLVVLWVAQNILLVASSILRTLDYIGAYSLTILRISALAWMLLVAIGLVLICVRMLKGSSAAWLINANALAAALLLALASIVDLGTISAAWNVRHAREAGGSGAALDLCYLRRLGPSALVSLVWLEGRVQEQHFRDRLIWVREQLLRQAEADQADWHRWTWRSARRLGAARAMLGGHPSRSLPASYGRECDGRIIPPPPPATNAAPSVPAAPAPPALTRKVER
ncbi:hypothetical protein CLG96_15565 [Sphingomonas oleivorans]|uniref:Uncharacterized protein n=1 Tax=Sphingomonas oleivorans TaxID=1735121 RepID=A0A2T5FV46_9SPHN|nr:DUF4173 domain-containing protein [Sphingomonas oleivorans]PTQ08602.1 hypothetical protein CLG96_15565 [Sphingomonas oleivorans]